MNCHTRTAVFFQTILSHAHCPHSHILLYCFLYCRFGLVDDAENAEHSYHGACDIGIASLYVYQANKVVKTDPNDPYMKYYIEDLKITLTFD